MTDTPLPPENRRWLSRAFQRAGRSLKTSLASVGAVTTAVGLYLVYQEQTKEENEKKKQVLYIPFDRLKLVEQKDPKNQFFSALVKDDASAQRPLVMTVREVVDAIHTAAADPNVVALYGTFGNMPTAGWSDLEEVRNALRVFRESHRRHAEPNVAHEVQVIPRIESKPLYCYAPTMMEPSNKEYYVASIFTHIHLQRQGELALFGLVSPQYFLRDFLQRYGIQLHVFKHGEYKNAPNMFTESSFTRPHRENVTELLQTINASQCDEITRSRSQALLTSWLHKNTKKRIDLWKQIQESGIFPAQTAWKTGLVDFLPWKDPLPDLLAWNNTSDEKKKEEIKSKWGHHETDFDRFTAEKTISIQKYVNKMKKKEQQAARRRQFDALIQKMEWLRPLLGATNDVASEKIALLYANGGITDSRPLVHCIRQIKQDNSVKCIVLRVNSPGGSVTACESIRRELDGLPLVVSFGNVAASGGYYVAAHANRIFAQQKTITGSIGVFAIRPDLTQLAKQYQVNVEHVTSSELAATFSPFHPLTRKMKKEIVRLVDRMYGQFKEICAEGRHLPLTEIEKLAKGRVWTGEQAKANGLVDELGGLSRALAYARRSYCSSAADVQVEEWPRAKAWYEQMIDKGDETKQRSGVKWTEGLLEHFARMNGTGSLLLTVDENAAIRCMLEGYEDDSFPSFFWE
ncbi:protease IV [Fistulifera solaris]|uniref:Protease IV n=1 Tax=Fistulifera solaris TaxID=1519565 RepID=A0A1Z5JA37_FISSO|nr:protease IV [Fistulifera solaris]|eukprot:GAX10829.1 protease IV [Fistulifera solaris]